MPNNVPAISRIIIFKLRQDLVGAFASRLAGYLEALDATASVVLDLGFVNSVDGYAINIIAETLARGVSVHLVNVRGRVRRMFRQARSVSSDQFAESVEAALLAIEQQRGEVPPAIRERRAYPRIRSHIPAEVIIDVNGRRIATDGIIRDISEGGVYIELLQKLSDLAGEEIDLNTAIDLRMTLPDVSYPCLVQGSTVHRGATAAGLYCGVKFGEITYLDEDAIRIFLYHHDPDRRAGSA